MSPPTPHLPQITSPPPRRKPRVCTRLCVPNWRIATVQGVRLPAQRLWIRELRRRGAVSESTAGTTKKRSHAAAPFTASHFHRLPRPAATRTRLQVVGLIDSTRVDEMVRARAASEEARQGVKAGMGPQRTAKDVGPGGRVELPRVAPLRRRVAQVEPRRTYDAAHPACRCTRNAQSQGGYDCAAGGTKSRLGTSPVGKAGHR